MLKPEYPPSTAVVCHDVGAANIIISSIQKLGHKGIRAYMRGPAQKIWETAFPEIPISKSLYAAIQGSKLVVSGTGWASNIEHQARRIARAERIHSVAIIDHWVNYLGRFIRNGQTIYPDEIWVVDEYALKIARRTFPNENIVQISNYYHAAQMQDISKVEKPDYPELLYVLEPARNNCGRDTAGKFQALHYFVNSLHLFGLLSSTVIKLRPHPSDYLGMYEKLIDTNKHLKIKLDQSDRIAHSIGRSSWVAGRESFALFIALMGGRKE